MPNLLSHHLALHGFQAISEGKIKSLSARTTELFHPVSGAQVLCIDNDDRELGFSILYRTPQPDETDACHMAEHLVLSSCKKYKSRDVFFDMDSKSYSTFMNGITDTAYTCYPICSESQKQLLKLADVVLCCMEEPDALTEPHFFEREVLRYELADLDAPLTMGGTVFGEDWAHLTDLEENADSHTARTLYPGLLASRLPGRAHFHYEDISRKKVEEVFHKYYNYSNCLIILYGHMDYDEVLSFLNREHLSRGSEKKSDCQNLIRKPALIHYLKPAVPGFRESEEASPAYKGSKMSQASVIDYALDLAHCSEEELICWDLFAGLLDNSTSPLHQIAKRNGLNHVIQVYLDTLLIRPVLKFRLFNGDRELKEPFLHAVRQALSEIHKKGISEELFRSSIKENRMTDSLAREGVHLGYHVAEEIGAYWSLTGKTDYFSLYERGFERFSMSIEKGQILIREMAEEALSPKISALTVTFPVPGLAETLEKKRNQFLEQKKAHMGRKEAEQLIKATRDFERWNQTELKNRGFLISPKELPAPPDCPPIFKERRQTITGYFSPVFSALTGSYQIYFDLSFLPPEEWPLLSLYQLLLTELDTPSLSVTEQKLGEQELLYNCTFDETFPGPEAGENSHPALSVFWYGFPDDFENSLDLLLELMGEADYSDTMSIVRTIEKYLPDYDLSQGENASSLSYVLAESAIRTDARFRAAVNDQKVYHFLQSTLKRLKENPGFGAELAKQLSQTARRILTRSRMLFLAAVPEKALSSVKQTAFEKLGKLPEQPEIIETQVPVPERQKFYLPSPIMRAAVSLDASSQEIRLMGDFSQRSDFKGRYLPFLIALSDQYLKPSIRYQNGAYDCGIDFSLANGYFSLWSTADPGLETTIEIFSKAGKALENLSIAEEELEGYILSAFAQGHPLSGPLNTRMRFMRREAAGISTDRINALLSDIPNASLDCQKDASRIIQDILESGALAAAGSRQIIEQSAYLFDQVEHLTS